MTGRTVSVVEWHELAPTIGTLFDGLIVAETGRITVQLVFLQMDCTSATCKCRYDFLAH
jgi:hypothetical protein